MRKFKWLRGLKWILVLTIAFGIFLVLNEAGVITVTAHQTSDVGEFSYSLANDTDLKGESVTLVFVDDLGEERSEQFSGREGENIWLDAELVRFDFEGDLWFPLYREGTCRYEVRVQARERDVHGEMAGKFQLNSRGLLPLRVLKDTLREKIYRQLRDNVEDRWRP